MSEHDPEQALDSLRLALTEFELSPGQLFGKPVIKRAGKAVIAAFHGDLVFKLADPAAALETSGATLWDPSGKGRPMKAWVVIPRAHAAQWPTWARLALG